MTTRCECCNRERPIIGVACLPYIAMSISWCKECLQAGAIPYWACVSNTAACGGWEHTSAEWQALVQLSLCYHKKPEAQFLADVAQALLDLENCS
jgi:hypothetical protein